MADFSSTVSVPPKEITSASKWSAFQAATAAGVVTATPASTNWPSANLTIYVPFAIPFDFNVRRVFWINGASTTGNADLGVYTRAGGKLFSTGATSRTGTSVVQYTSLSTPFMLSPGDYYMALSATSGSGAFIRFAPSILSDLRLVGLLQQTSANPLPATATYAALGQSYWPLFGLSSLGSGF